MKKFIFFLFLLAILTIFLPPKTSAQTQEGKILKNIFQQLLTIREKVKNLETPESSLITTKDAEILLKIKGEGEKLKSEKITIQKFLELLFESRKIFPQREDFLFETQNPVLDFAKILNLIPQENNGSEFLRKNQAQKIIKDFESIKNKIRRDGLWGKIDFHEHYRTGGKIEDFFKASGALGISKTIFLPTGWAPDNQGFKNYQLFLLYFKKLFPEKIIAFCTIDEKDKRAFSDLEECLKNGGEGLKILGGHPNFYDEKLDSPKMYQVYEIAKKYKVPVLIHASIINLPELEKQVARIFADFPEITFIQAHYCSTIFNGIHLEKCQKLLDEHPNLYIDISMGGGLKRYQKYFAEDIQKVKDFLIKNQDRILFGSDIILDNSKEKNVDFVYERIKCDLDLHQKENYTCAFGEKDLRQPGFALPREVLKKLYYENPLKILKKKAN
jgi:predicted TIM-barrel fold metal-dependent hydrolase